MGLWMFYDLVLILTLPFAAIYHYFFELCWLEAAVSVMCSLNRFTVIYSVWQYYVRHSMAMRSSLHRLALAFIIGFMLAIEGPILCAWTHPGYLPLCKRLIALVTYHYI